MKNISELGATILGDSRLNTLTLSLRIGCGGSCTVNSTAPTKGDARLENREKIRFGMELVLLAASFIFRVKSCDLNSMRQR